MLIVPLQLEADRDWQEATRLLETFEYDGALGHLENALARETRTEPERARVLVRIGLIHAQLMREDAAVSSFERALLADENVSLGDDASPNIVPLFTAAVRRVAERRSTEASATPAPAPSTPPNPEPTASAMDPGGAPIATVGWVALGGGGATAVVGAGMWGAGFALLSVAEGQEFQSDVQTWGERSAWAQIGGLAVGIVGVAIGVVGAGVLGVALVAEGD